MSDPRASGIGFEDSPRILLLSGIAFEGVRSARPSGVGFEGDPDPNAETPINPVPDNETPFEVTVMYDPVTETLNIQAIMAGYTEKVVTEVVVANGVEELTPLLARMTRPRLLVIQSDNEFTINFGSGESIPMTFLMQQLTQDEGLSQVDVIATDGTILKVYAAGDP